MSDDPSTRAPEPKPDERPEPLLSSRPSEVPPEPKAQAQPKAASSGQRPKAGGRAPKAAQRKAEPTRPTATPAAAPKAVARVQRKAGPPAKKAASKRATAKPEPAKPLQRKAEPASKPRAEKPASKAAAAKAVPAPARAESPPPTRPPEAPKPLATPARTSPATSGATTSPSPAARPLVQRAAAVAETLDAIGRRVLGRLERTERALSPWTQQSLKLQQPTQLPQPALRPGAIADVPGKSPAQTTAAHEAAPIGPGAQNAEPASQTPAQASRAARAESSLGSLAKRVQRQEQQGATGTFGRLAEGVERADRFASRIAAHFPPLAAKYEPLPAPEAGTGNVAPAPSGPSFTYYPEGARGGASSQSAMTAAEVLQRFGGATSTSPAQRTAAPTGEPARPTSPPATPSPRDPRRVRRFSKIEEMPPHGATNAEPPAPPEPQRIQRKPEATAPAAPRTAAEAKEQLPARPPRRRSHTEEVSTPGGEPPAVQPTPSPAAKPAASASAIDQPGPMRWDHLNNLPPSMQRQLERVQQRLAEQSGLAGPPPASVGDTTRPFFPRNPNGPPVDPTRPTRARPASAESEPETPIAFGPDLQPRPVGVQRQVQPPAGSQATRGPQSPAQPPQRPNEVAADVGEGVSARPATTELERPAASPPAIQRRPETPPEPEPDQLPFAATEPAVETEIAPEAGAIQPSPEPSQPADATMAELTLRQPPTRQPTEVLPEAQRPPVEPTAPLRHGEPDIEPAAPKAATRAEARAQPVAPAAEVRLATGAPQRQPVEMETPKPVVQRSPLPEQPLVLREPQATDSGPAVPAQPTTAGGSPEPSGAPAPVESDSSRPEPRASAPGTASHRVDELAEPGALAPPERGTPAAEPQRQIIKGSHEPPAEVPTEPAKPASDTQRQTLPAGEMPLRVPPLDSSAAGDSTIVASEGEAPLSSEQQAVPSRDLHEPLTGVSRSSPAAAAAVQRQEVLQPTQGPTLEMPLRQSVGAPESEPSRMAELSLGRQIYARGIKDTQMPLIGTLATNLRPSLQRQPAAPAPGGAMPFGSAPVAGLARTATVQTPVLPQARVQRELPDEGAPAPAPQPNAPASQEPASPPPAQKWQRATPWMATSMPDANPPLVSGGEAGQWQRATPRVNTPKPGEGLPLVSASDGGNGQPTTTPTTDGQWLPAKPRVSPPKAAASLPLAPVAARNGGNGQPATTSSKDEPKPGDVDDLVPDTDDSTPASTSTPEVEQIDLDDLADQLLPYIKRLMAVERERHDPV